MRKIDLYYENYISEKISELKEIINNSENKRILIISDTGSGKTSTMLELMKSLNRGYVVMVPFTAQVKQYKVKQLEGLEALSGNEKLMSESSNVLMTYDKYRQIRKLNSLGERILILDEAHSLITSRDFRGEALEGVEESEKYFEKVIHITATPNEILGDQSLDKDELRQSEFINYDVVINFKALNKRIVSKEFNLYQLYSQSEKQGIEMLLNAVLENYNPEKIDVIRVNSKERLDIISEYLISLGYKTEVLTREVKGISSVYQEICFEEKIETKINFLLVTSLLDDGININNTNINNVWMFNTSRLVPLKQFSARFRNGYNSFNIFNCRDPKVLKISKEEKELNLQHHINEIAKVYKAFSSRENMMRRNNFIQKYLRYENYLRHTSNGFNLYSAINRIYMGEEVIDSFDPERLQQKLKKLYNLDFNFIPLKCNDKKNSFENYERKIAQDKGKALKNIRCYLEEYGDELVSLYKDLHENSKTDALGRNTGLRSEIYRKCISELTGYESRLIEKYIMLKDYNLSHDIVIGLLPEQTKKINRFIDTISYLKIIENENSLLNIEGQIINQITGYINNHKIIRYSKEEAKKVSDQLKSIFNISNLSHNTVMKWLRIMYQVKVLKGGKKRQEIIGSQTYEALAKEFGFSPESLKNNDILEACFYSNIRSEISKKN